MLLFDGTMVFVIGHIQFVMSGFGFIMKPVSFTSQTEWPGSVGVVLCNVIVVCYVCFGTF